MSDKKLFLIILLISFLFSNIFLFGIIDQDYFSFLHVGHGISQGFSIYGDFADNKGPFLFIFFAILNLIFSDNYSLGLVLTHFLISSLSIYLIFKILIRDWKLTWFEKGTANILLIIFFVAFYDSFSISFSAGGFYSENLGMLFFLLSIWFLGTKSSIISGVLISLAILSRQTFIFFIPYLLVEIFFKYKKTKNFIGFMLGGLIPMGISLSWFYRNNELNDLYYNTIKFNINYAKTIKNLRIVSIIISTYAETRILVSLAITFTYTFINLTSRNNSREKIIYSTLLICSIFATFVGGIFYTHHFIQFSLITLISIVALIKIKKIKTISFPLMLLLAVFILLSYLFYILGSNSYIKEDSFRKTPQISEINNFKYLIVMPYYPIFYLQYDKFSPDKYYSYQFLSELKNVNNSELKKHESLSNEKLTNTLFLFVLRNEGDQRLINEYKANFGYKFKLKKINEYSNEYEKIEVYESEIGN